MKRLLMLRMLSGCEAMLLLGSLILASSVRAEPQRDDLSWMRGANYVPSYAKNDVQLWMEYDGAVIDRELGYAQQLKLNTVRVFLQVAVYEKQPEKFMADFESLVALCDKHKIKLMPVLFDSCFDPQVVDVNNYRGKNWIPSPGFSRLGNEDWPAMENYIKALVGKYKDDRRVVLWDVMNEPESTAEFGKPEGKAKIVDFVRRAIARVREEKPVQPVGVGWAFLRNVNLSADISDVLILHNYANPKGLLADIQRIKEMGTSLNKPVILNEFVGRPQQRIEEAMPVVAKENVGWCFWELMIGSTQFSQGRSPYQGHIYPDGTCYSVKEVASILSPEGYTGVAEDVAGKAGFKVSDKAVKSFAEEGITQASAGAAGKQWTKERAWAWYNAQPWINGVNYLPSYAGNVTEFWQDDTFNAEIIDRELALAEGIGINSVRILMQYLVWENNPDSYKKHFAKFLELAAKHRISVMPQLFDDCAFGQQSDVWKRRNPYIGKQDDPIPGVFFPNWAPSPGHNRVNDPSSWPRLKAYVQDFLRTYRDDRRVLAWDLYNEPMNVNGTNSLPLLQAVFDWGREIDPSQPLTASLWGPGALEKIIPANSDVITFHQYPAPDLNRCKDTGRPVICTEWMYRCLGTNRYTGIVEKTLPRLKEAKMGSYMWGLVNGRSQAQFEWGSKPGTPEPRIWFTDLFRDVSGTPYDSKEIEAIRGVSGAEGKQRIAKERERR